MAAPNIVGITTITGKTNTLKLTGTSASILLTNAANSGQVFKVNNIIAANVAAGGTTTKLQVAYNPSATGVGTNFFIASNVGIASESTLVIIDKASAIYLEENASIVVTANVGNALDVTASFEVIS